MLLLDQILLRSCVACHGADGNSINTDWPKIAGQNEKYLYEQLKYFKSGERNNALMMTVTPYLQTLNDKDLLDIAAFYSSNVSTGGQAKNDENCLSLEQNYIDLEILKSKYPHAPLVILFMVMGII